MFKRPTAAFFLTVVLAAPWPAPPVQAQQQELPVEPLAIETAAGKRLFRVEVARTEQQRAIGLMWREQMDPDKGMLFDFETERHVVMWMKNTPLSLDMLFIALDGRIATIANYTKPYSTDRIPSGVQVGAVLELVAGSAQRLGIAPGDQVRHSMFGNPP